MAVPKKKSSRSLRNMRRFSAAYQLDPISESTCQFTQSPVRSHTVSIKAIKEGLFEAKKKTKSKSASAQA
jgi:ribosomal protein L32